ncbi:MAG TPA: efflux RND transporter periplasmic adaptor subunit [Candidatus Acidoferrales bacterium]|nr:efflux RND transporter periplasmic adaptor subunit [Candidatus Acidoferrales bacterium]
MKKRRKLMIVVILLVIVTGTGVVVSGFFKKTRTFPPEKIVTVERGSLARSVVATGKIEPLSKVEVKSKANGIIKALLVNVGDRVKVGQVLVELDKENLQARVREARASLEAEEANLRAAIAAEMKARVEASTPDLLFARREYERALALLEQGILSQQQFDDAHKVYELARNRQELLEAAVRNAAAQVEHARARVAAARAALDRAEEELRNATIVSPIDGVVLTRDREVGDAVSSILNLGSAATLILTLGDTSTVYVKGRVDEADVGKIRVGLPARITVESFPDQTFQGTVTKIAPMGVEKDNVTSFEVRVSIANPTGALRVNMSANAEIILEEHHNVLIIPESAIIYEKDGSAWVQILDPSSPEGFRKVRIKIGISNGQRTEVLDGLKEGDKILLP